MALYKIMKYVYGEIEEALRMSDAFKGLFTAEGIYKSHSVIPITGSRFMLEFKVEDNGVNNKG